MTESSLPTPSVDELTKAFNNDLDLMLFYATWIKNGLDATKAYEELHPDVTHGSAKVLGSRSLAKVNREAIMQAYELDHQAYYIQLREGLKATKWNDFTGEREADHNTRAKYHDKLGKQLGIETDKPAVAVQVNTSLNLDKYVND